ncbi:MAG: hypothetical protein ABJN69_12570 [Hellea sp.]
MTETPIEPSEEIRSANQRFMSFNRVASLTAVAVSTLALLVSVLEVNAIKSQQRAAVWPFIALSSSYTDQGFTFKLENKGVGPALVHAVDITYEDQRYRDLDALIVETLGEENAFSYDVYSGVNPSGSVLGVGDTVILFSVPWEDRTQKLLEKWNDKVNVTACYCSIQEECWTAQLSQGMAESSNSCKNPET